MKGRWFECPVETRAKIKKKKKREREERERERKISEAAQMSEYAAYTNAFETSESNERENERERVRGRECKVRMRE